MRTKKKVSKIQTLVIVSVVIALFLLFFIVTFLSGRITMNPAGTIGNTAGNINNSGLFCEYDGTVYFSNPLDSGSLYAMNADESNVRKLNDLNVRNILAGGKYLYFFQMGSTAEAGFGSVVSAKSFNRSDLAGKKTTSLTHDVVVKGQLVDNYLYLLVSEKSGPSFYKMKIDKTDMVPLAKYEINPACAENGIIYYNGTEDNHYLYGLDTSTDTPYEIWQGNLWYPILQGDYIYYMDVSANYRLCRYSLSQNVVEILTDDRVDCFNVSGEYVYYQKNGDTPQLKCMRTDGTDVKVIAEGNYTNINMTSQYVYFQAFGIENSLYHSYIGSDSYAPFAMP